MASEGGLIRSSDGGDSIMVTLAPDECILKLRGERLVCLRQDDEHTEAGHDSLFFGTTRGEH